MWINRTLSPHFITHFHRRRKVGQQSECVDGGWVKRLGNGAAVRQRAVAEIRIHDVKTALREPEWDTLGSIRAFDDGKQLVTDGIERLSVQQVFRITEEGYPIISLYVVTPVFVNQIGDDVWTHDGIERYKFGNMLEAGKRKVSFPAFQCFWGASLTNRIEPLAHRVCSPGFTEACRQVNAEEWGGLRSIQQHAYEAALPTCFMEVCSAQFTIIRHRNRLVTLRLEPVVGYAICNLMFNKRVRSKIEYQNRTRWLLPL